MLQRWHIKVDRKVTYVDNFQFDEYLGHIKELLKFTLYRVSTKKAY